MLKSLKNLGQQFTHSPQQDRGWRESNRKRYPGLLILTLALMTLGFTVMLGQVPGIGDAIQAPSATKAPADRKPLPAATPIAPPAAPSPITHSEITPAPAPIANSIPASEAAPAPVASAPEAPAPVADSAAIKAQSRAASRYAVVESTFNAWQQAWRERNVDAYLGFYADAFVPPGGIARTEWVKQRQQRLPRQTGMTLTMSEVRITAKDESNYVVQFVQDFSIPSFSEFGTHKELHLREEAGAWKIVQEIVLTPGSPTR